MASSSVTPPVEERFAMNTIIMADAIHESVSRLYNAGYKIIKPDMILYVKAFMAGFNKHYLIQGFIRTSASEFPASKKSKYPTCWDGIKARDEPFFAENAGDIFKFLPSGNVNLFKDLYLTKNANGEFVVSADLKDSLWKLFDAMIRQSIKYIHIESQPYSYMEADGTLKTAYRKTLFDDIGVIDLARHAQLWNVKLEFPNA